MTTVETKRLHQKCSELIEEFRAREDNIPEAELELITKTFGGEESLLPYESPSSVRSGLQSIM